MAITVQQVYEQQRVDKVDSDKKILALREDVEIVLRKTSDIASSLNTSACLTSCEINKIIKNYIREVDIYIADVDDSVLGTLTLLASDPELPPINIDLCPHVGHCETKTTLAKGTGSTLIYTGEGSLQTIDLSPMLIASNILWSGTMTGYANTTVQNMLDTLVLAQEDVIDCSYFTGTGVGTTTLGIDDLTDVNISGPTLNVGDTLRWDGISWVPYSITGTTFTCASLGGCSIGALSNVTLATLISGDILVYDSVLGTFNNTNISSFIQPGAFISADADSIIREGTNVNQYNRDFVIGSPSVDGDGNASHRNRFIFNKSKGAVVGGSASSTQFDDANVGSHAVALGRNVQAPRYSSVAIGDSCSVTQNYGVAIGHGNASNNFFALALGSQTTADGYASVATGIRTTASIYGSRVHSAGRGQIVEAIASNFTTDGTTKQLFTDYGVDLVSPSHHLTIPTSTSWHFKVSLVARQYAGTAGTEGDTHVFEIEGVIKRDATTNVSFVGTPTVATVANDAPANAWTASVVADSSISALRIDVVGETNKSIRWAANVRATELSS